jgi:hypothetical protein
VGALEQSGAVCFFYSLHLMQSWPTKLTAGQGKVMGGILDHVRLDRPTDF